MTKEYFARKDAEDKIEASIGKAEKTLEKSEALLAV